MTFKLSAGLAILFIALALQFWLASVGISIDLTFATLISFAFLFDFWELIILVLLGVFIVNWQPTASLEILIFAIFPVAAHFSSGVLHWQPWIENLIAIMLGFLVLYGAVAGTAFLYHPQAFLTDLVAGLIFSTLIFFPMYRWEKYCILNERQNPTRRLLNFHCATPGAAILRSRRCLSATARFCIWVRRSWPSY